MRLRTGFWLGVLVEEGGFDVVSVVMTEALESSINGVFGDLLYVNSADENNHWLRASAVTNICGHL
jgi:hypothetical protein